VFLSGFSIYLIPAQNKLVNLDKGTAVEERLNAFPGSLLSPLVLSINTSLTTPKIRRLVHQVQTIRHPGQVTRTFRFHDFRLVFGKPL
jgi:hypothetical protein